MTLTPLTRKEQQPERWLPDDPTRALSFGVTSPADVVAAQDKANETREQRVRRSSVRALTARIAWEDAAEAFRGIPNDLYAGKSLHETFTKDDRLRGLGVLLGAVALALLLVAS